MTAPTWMALSNCRGVDPDLFFSDDDTAAKKICRGCEVTDECLSYAFADPEAWKHGVWGNTSASERRQIRRRAA